MSLLGFCDELLSSHAPEPTVAQEVIDRMRAELEVFSREVRGADLDPQLSEYILHYIDLIDRALIDYRIMGIEAIRTGVDAAGGFVFTRKSAVQQVMQSEFKTKFAAAFVGLMILCQGYSGAKEMLSDAKRLLPEFAEEAEVELKQDKQLPAATLPVEVKTTETT